MLSSGLRFYILSASTHELLSFFPSSPLSDNVSGQKIISFHSVSVCHRFHCVSYVCTLSSNSALHLEVQSLNSVKYAADGTKGKCREKSVIRGLEL